VQWSFPTLTQDHCGRKFQVTAAGAGRDFNRRGRNGLRTNAIPLPASTRRERLDAALNLQRPCTLPYFTDHSDYRTTRRQVEANLNMAWEAMKQAQKAQGAQY
jgi:hypothetical protein